MALAGQLTLWPKAAPPPPTDDWTFKGASTRERTHCYHDYPAKMIPQVAGKLLDLFGTKATKLFDPYCGTGTSLVEGMVRGLNVAGTDLNPLARLVAKAKTTLMPWDLVQQEVARFTQFALQIASGVTSPMAWQTKNAYLVSWFKPEAADKLATIHHFIEGLADERVRLFFEVAFSETVRESSNTRNEEFKLYRYAEEKLETFNPDVFGIFTQKLSRNLAGLRDFLAAVDQTNRHPTAEIFSFNTVNGIPTATIPPASVEMVVTSPPYGDSRTTVAYGQYSRLSAEWLGLPTPAQVDRQLMGGTAAKQFTPLPSPALNEAIGQIMGLDEKRALEVASFYNDLHASIQHVAPLIKPNGYACYVVGNRKVKGVVLPTDTAVCDFFRQWGFGHVETFRRMIPNKRMPLRNSPSNVAGVSDNTMVSEYIVVMQRPNHL